MSTQHTQSGFILPTILAISFAIIAVMVGLLLVTSTSYKSGYVDHYQKLADEAAEAGAAYATACLTLSSHIQTWGSAASGGARPNLTPNTSCNGTNSYPSHTYVYSDSTVRTFFNVGNLDYSQQFSAQISALGYAQVLKSDGTVEKTYTSVQKKVITWPTEVVGQMSASGTNRTCAIVTYNVYCWGYNRYGQLGDGRYIGGVAGEGIGSSSAIDSAIPVKVYKAPGVMAGKDIVKIFVAQNHSCALSQDGKMYCWGYNSAGQLGNNSTTDSPVPIQVGGALTGLTVTDIGGTSNATCAIANSKIYCWGSNSMGVTGRGVTAGGTLTPTLVTAGGTATTLPAAYTATKLSTSGSRSRVMCAIAGGKAYCWGENDNGSVGDGTITQRLIPTKVSESTGLSGKTVTAISQDGYTSNGAGGFAHVCAIASGVLYCWGENGDGQLGNGSTSDYSFSPVAVVTNTGLSGKTIQDVQVGLRHSCVRASGGVYCWGYNSSGQVGDNSYISRSSPVAVAQQPGGLTSSNVTTIGAGANRGCAAVTDGRTFCWGLNGQGQIGDGTTIDRNVPTESLFLRPTGNQYIF